MAKSQSLEKLLISCVTDRWQKMSMVIARLSEKIENKNISDEFINDVTEVTKKLINDGLIEHHGDISNIRYSEVRKLDAHRIVRDV